MVRASTRSKTAASVAAAKPKALSSKKNADVKAAAKVASVKSAPSNAQTRKPTRTSARGKKGAKDNKESEGVEVGEETGLEPAVAGTDDVGMDSNLDHPAKDDASADDDHSGDEAKTPVESGDADDKTWCICKGKDDGSPMITCEGCNNWYHFRCVAITQSEADDIGMYICSKCHTETGKTSTMKWEMGSDNEKEPKTAAEESPKVNAKSQPEGGADASSSDGDSSEDEDYVDEYRRAKQNQRKNSTRLPARTPTPSRSPSPSAPQAPSSRRRKPSTRLTESGRSAAFLKRKTSISHAPEPPSAPSTKRTKSGDSAGKAKKSEQPKAEDDPVRKYCVGKLKEVVVPIFVQYRPDAAPPPASPRDDEPEKDEKDKEEVLVAEPEQLPLSDEQKAEAEQKATAFVEELERCMFEGYSEPDKKDKKAAGPKYKERFRMLTFNLEKPDRTELRSRIASGQITPAELSQMSSTDLANEKLQQEIESARLLSLKDTILEQRILAPRAKMTHKGEEVIEDVSGAAVAEDLRAVEERTEKEKNDAEEAQVEEEIVRSPVDDMSSPLMDMHLAQSPLDTTGMHSPTAAGFDISEVLGDMGMPEEARPESPTMTTSPFKPPPITIPTPFPGPASASLRSASLSAGPGSSNAVLASALLSASQATPSFSLSSVWGGATDGPPPDMPAATDLDPVIAPPEADDGEQDMDIAENDFDMFFDRGEMFEPADETEAMDTDQPQGGVAAVESKNEMAEYEELPVVWNGAVQMPIDATSAWTTRVDARQIGGRDLGLSDSVWRKLFTQPIARIDGRVPVENSTNYLVDTRLNPTRELVAVALTPCNPDDSEFTRLLDFLIGKNRHALVFPWAGLPPDQVVGKDFYLVPFKPEHPIPEFIDLLDNVRLPKQRTYNMMLGIFVLNKGRLVVPESITPPTSDIPGFGGPHLQSAPPPPATAGAPPVTSLASLLPGGLTEQGKNLLQTLVASGGIGALAPSLAQSSFPPALGSAPPPGPPVPSSAGYGSPYGAGAPAHSPPRAVYPESTPYPPGPPPPMGYSQYPPPLPPTNVPPYPPGSSRSPPYHSGPDAYPSHPIDYDRRDAYRRSPSPGRRRYDVYGGRSPDRGPRYEDRGPRDWRRDAPSPRGRGRGRPNDREWRGRRGGW